MKTLNLIRLVTSAATMLASGMTAGGQTTTPPGVIPLPFSPIQLYLVSPTNRPAPGQFLQALDTNGLSLWVNGSGGGGIFIVMGTNVTAQTNGSVVTVNADVSHTEVSNATNGLNGVVVPQGRTLTIAGTANQITSSAGAQDLSANRTVTLSLPASVTIGGTMTAGLFSGSGASLTALDAGQLTGSISDARLSANVSLLGSSIDLSGSEATGILAAGRFPALTGAITTSSGSLATSLGSFTSANLAGAITDETGSGAAVFGTSPTIVTPTIASFVNATHNHQAAAGGGALDAAAVTTGVFAIGRLATGTPDGTKFVRDDGTLVTPASGGGGGVSNSIPLTIFAADGTNIWLNATQANSFFFYATNNFIVNVTNVSGQCALGETRRLIVQQGGNFTASLTNTLRMSFGKEITGFNISTTTNSVNWVAFGHFATSNRWDTLGNVTTYGP